MKSFIVFALFVAAAVALPTYEQQQQVYQQVYQPSKDAQILRYDNNNIGVDGYNYAVETSDGKKANEEAILKNVGTENEAIEVRGQYSYILDGITYTVTYIANENGFQPQGEHIPRN